MEIQECIIADVLPFSTPCPPSLLDREVLIKDVRFLFGMISTGLTQVSWPNQAAGSGVFFCFFSHTEKADSCD